MEKKQNEYQDQIEGRNSVLEVLESGRDINKIYIQSGDKHGSINKIISIANKRKIRRIFLCIIKKPLCIQNVKIRKKHAINSQITQNIVPDPT